MLSTLIRYDFKRLFKWVLPSCGLILLSAVFFDLIHWRLSNPSAFEKSLIIPYELLSYVLMLGIYAGCLAGFAVVCNHFYKNLMTDEGYLTFTLPVSQNQILASKVITGVVSVLLVVLCAIVAVSLISIGLTLETVMAEVAESEAAIETEEGLTNYGPELLSILLYGFTLLVLSVLQIYFSTVMGCTVAKTHKVAASIGFWYLTGVVINSILISFIVSFIDTAFETINMPATLLLMSVLNIALCAGLYCWSLHRLKNKLNLQ